MRIFNKIEFISMGQEGRVRIDGTEYGAVIGKHEFWIPDLEIKFIGSINGKVESWNAWHLGQYKEDILNGTFNDDVIWDEDSLKSVLHELAIFRLLALQKLSPEVGELVYIKELVWSVPYGVKISDPMGMFGFEMKDAGKLPEGKFTFDKFKKFADRYLDISAGAMGDVAKPTNTVNGYLVDVRRTLWDMMKLKKGVKVEDIPFPFENESELRKKVADLSQFPYKQRKENYQSYWLKNGYEEGSRDTLYRLGILGVEDDLTGKTVVDLGGQLGAVAQECYRRGARKVTVIEKEKDYVECGVSLARANGFYINYQRMDLERDTEKVIKYLNELYLEGIDELFALALYKHIGDKLFLLLKELNWKKCYVESHSAKDGLETPHVREMAEKMNKLDCKISYTGTVTDRSNRETWVLTK